MADDSLPLQEQVLGLLCFDRKWGAQIAAQLSASDFDGVYRHFASQVLRYRKRYGKPPGQQQVDDLAERTLGDKDNVVVKKRLLPKLLAVRKGINGEYVAVRVADWVDWQRLRQSMIEAIDRSEVEDESRTSDVRKILGPAVRGVQTAAMKPGVRLTSPSLLQFATTDDEFISLDIKELDKLGIGLTKKELLLYMAPKGSGKTWFSVHCGKVALKQWQKVLHISLEMGEQKIGRRYLQALFAVARRRERYKMAKLLFDGVGDRKVVTGFKPTRAKPRLAFSMSRSRRILRAKQRSFGIRLGNLLVKDFPSGTLTMDKLVGFLDYLAEVEGFIPDVLIVDYPDLMSTNTRTQRQDIGRNFVDLRGLAAERNMALVCPTQVNRKSIYAKRVRSTGVAEDITKIMTADTVFAFSRTDVEAEFGLGRLAVEHARDNEGGLVLILAQSYHTGQYVLESARHNEGYWEQVRELMDDTKDSDQ